MPNFMQVNTVIRMIPSINALALTMKPTATKRRRTTKALMLVLKDAPVMSNHCISSISHTGLYSN